MRWLVTFMIPGAAALTSALHVGVSRSNWMEKRDISIMVQPAKLTTESTTMKSFDSGELLPSLAYKGGAFALIAKAVVESEPYAVALMQIATAALIASKFETRHWRKAGSSAQTPASTSPVTHGFMWRPKYQFKVLMEIVGMSILLGMSPANPMVPLGAAVMVMGHIIVGTREPLPTLLGSTKRLYLFVLAEAAVVSSFCPQGSWLRNAWATFYAGFVVGLIGDKVFRRDQSPTVAPPSDISTQNNIDIKNASLPEALPSRKERESEGPATTQRGDQRTTLSQTDSAVAAKPVKASKLKGSTPAGAATPPKTEASKVYKSQESTAPPPTLPVRSLQPNGVRARIPPPGPTDQIASHIDRVREWLLTSSDSTAAFLGEEAAAPTLSAAQNSKPRQGSSSSVSPISSKGAASGQESVKTTQEARSTNATNSGSSPNASSVMGLMPSSAVAEGAKAFNASSATSSPAVQLVETASSSLNGSSVTSPAEVSKVAGLPSSSKVKEVAISARPLNSPEVKTPVPLPKSDEEPSGSAAWLLPLCFFIYSLTTLF